MTRSIRVLVADDQAIVRKGIRALLATEPGIEVVGEAVNGQVAVAEAERLRPDVILMDLVMPEMDGIEAIRRITTHQPEVHILVLTSFTTDDKVFPAVKAGALGYLLKDADPQELVQAIHRVYQGDSSLHPTIARKLLQELSRVSQERPTPEQLTNREVDFYDFIPLPNGRLGILVADVTDKGMGAALVMALSRTLIRTYAVEYDTQPELVLSAANRRILEDAHMDLFVTVFYGILDPGDGTLTYCNAGHNPPYVLRAQSSDPPQGLIRTGIPIGIFENTTWQRDAVQIMPGDVLVLYTDGVTDAQNQRETSFGRERLLEIAQANLGRSAQAMLEALIAGVHEFAGDVSQFDDIALVVVVRDARRTITAVEVGR